MNFVSFAHSSSPGAQNAALCVVGITLLSKRMKCRPYESRLELC